MLVFPDSSMVVHLVGIGGIGMSGIAELMHHLGCKIQGSDMAENANIKRLQVLGINVMIGHQASNIQGASVLVMSSAVKGDNVEITAARASNIPVIKRAEMLAELMRLKKSVAIGGTHGKTTTTSIVGAMFEAAGHDPTVINGGIINRYGSNTRTGAGDWLIAEADESDGSFTKLPAGIVVVTNIDPEHMEHYGDFETLRQAFIRFIHNIPFYGFAVLCADHSEVLKVMAQISDRRMITYGFSPQSMVRGVNLRHSKEGMWFDVEASLHVSANQSMEQAIILKGLFLPVHGEYNVSNALAAVAIGLECGFSHQAIVKSLRNFSGVKRRFTHTGTVKNIKIIDDYGHHPVEIKAVLKTARQICEQTLIAVVQPHRYSRLHDLFDDFQTAFHDADIVVIADVYEAGEQPIKGADKDSLVAAVMQAGHKQALALSSPEALPELIAQLLKDKDLTSDDKQHMVVLLGAGSSTLWAQQLPEALEALL
ncbi:MAG: UDP-N-acetylmuramate--L-alanine ligase [Alphaproteobacteria bacterium]|nr:UDP-N-acetylmuramate--L-alanine ligase [Alphaproteobacteria bacterium]